MFLHHRHRHRLAEVGLDFKSQSCVLTVDMILLWMSGPKEVQVEYLDDDVGNVESKADTGWDPDNHDAESCQVARCAECWWLKNKEKS